MIGKTISHYKILEELGGGGMGVVYKAEDILLKRNVALKFLPHTFSRDTDAKERFIHEARAASSLEHNNICTLHEIEKTEDDQIFICMAYCDGETLKKRIERGPLAIDQAVGIALQISRGLARAHESNIIHRDIKPANIMITSRGEVKIVDFGLAKLAGQTTITKSGSTVGTVAYMSPEQARGEKVDHRTDIWSFGAVLYEMVTGQRPFQSEYDQALVYLILNEKFEKISSYRKDAPAELENIIDRCLQKDPAARYQAVTDLQKDLDKLTGRTFLKPASSGTFRRISIPVTLIVLLIAFLSLPAVRQRISDWFSYEVLPGEKHLVVLPFTNIGSDPANQAFCDGLAETLTSELTRLAQFHRSVWVVPMSEVRGEKIASASQAQKQFGATLAVTGSVQRGGNQIRLTMNLVDAKTLRQLESSVIDDRIESLSTFQNGVLIKLADMLRIELEPQNLKKITAGSTSVSRAYDLYLQGRGHLQRYEKTESIDKAINLFSKAIEEDSTYALAYAGLGEAFWRKFENSKDVVWVDLAIKNCKQGVNLNDQLEPVHATLGLIYTGTGRYDEAVREYQRAISIDSGSAGAYGGLAKSYNAQGKLEDAEKAYKKAIELKPDYWGYYNDLGRFYYVHGRYEDAAVQFRLVVKLTPDNTRGLNNVGGIYAMLQRWDEAKEMFEKSLKVEPTSEAYSNLAYVYYYNTADYTKAARMYERTLDYNDKDYTSWGNLGSAYYWSSGERDKAANAYTRAIRLAEEQLKVNPKDPEVLSALGAYYSDLEDKEKAFKFIGEALLADAKNVQVMFRAGYIYEHMGDRDKALQWIEKALINGYSLSEMEHEPGLRELCSDVRFQKLREKYQSKK